jgi:spermidine/putrescine transport system permease protein
VIQKRSILAVPAILWFLLFVFVPVLIVFAVSLATRGTYGGFEWTISFANYLESFSESYLGILFASLQLAISTTLTCAVLGILMAWAIATAKPSQRHFYICAVALPFLTNLIIRVYAIRLFVGFEGPLQSTLSFFGIPFDPFVFSQNPVLVFYGMVTTYLPFMIFPLYGAFEKFDFALVEAAQDLGAGPWRIFRTVILPNLKPALKSGSLLVFIPCLGEYVIPDLLGGAKTMLFGNLIAGEFLKSRNWPLGSSFSIILIVILLLVAFVFAKTQKGKRDV